MTNVGASSTDAPGPPPIRLIGDIACPWTYLTLLSIGRAFDGWPPLEWHPFLLNTSELVRRRHRVVGAVAHHAARMGAPFALEALAQPLDARLVHGVVLAAAADGEGAGAAHALFDARFAKAWPLVQREAVADALAPSFAPTEVERWLATSGTFRGAIERATRAARLAGVNEIPLAVVDNTDVIGGLQPPETYRALAELASIRAADMDAGHYRGRDGAA